MPNSAERSESMTTSIIMLIMIFTAIAGFGWCIKHGLEESFPPNKTITKPVNK